MFPILANGSNLMSNRSSVECYTDIASQFYPAILDIGYCHIQKFIKSHLFLFVIQSALIRLPFGHNPIVIGHVVPYRYCVIFFEHSAEPLRPLTKVDTQGNGNKTL